MNGTATHKEASQALVDFFRRPAAAPGEPTPTPTADAFSAVLARLEAVEERLRDAEARLSELDGR